LGLDVKTESYTAEIEAIIKKATDEAYERGKADAKRELLERALDSSSHRAAWRTAESALWLRSQ